MIVFIDSGILGKLSNPNRTEETIAVNNWLFSLLGKGVYVVSSHVCDYEVRRSLILESLRKTNVDSIQELDDLDNYLTFLPRNAVTRTRLRLPQATE